MKRSLKVIISLFYLIVSKVICFFSTGSETKCTVLYYHSIFSHEKSNFQKQMRLLSKKATVINSTSQENLDNKKLYIIITFDDGFENLITNAVPSLMQYNLPFTIFFISSYFNKTPNWQFDNSTPDQKENIMSIEQMNELPNDLLTIGSHTVSHSKLTDLSLKDVENELVQSKEELERLAGRNVDIFSFPNGEYNENIINKCQDVGYKRVFTIEPKNALKNPHEFVTGRIAVSGHDWTIEFWLKIQGAYNWMSEFSNIKKKIIRN